MNDRIPLALKRMDTDKVCAYLAIAISLANIVFVAVLFAQTRARLAALKAEAQPPAIDPEPLGCVVLLSKMDTVILERLRKHDEQIARLNDRADSADRRFDKQLFAIELLDLLRKRHLENTEARLDIMEASIHDTPCSVTIHLAEQPLSGGY